MRTLKRNLARSNKQKNTLKKKFTKFVLPAAPVGFNQKQSNFSASQRKGQASKKGGPNSKNNSNSVASQQRALSLSQLLARLRQQRQKKVDQEKRQKPIKPIIPPKSLVLILKEKPEKIVYNRRIIDYKHCGLLQRYIGLGGKILPRRQTRLTAKQQRYVAKTIKSARVMGLLPFVNKERGFFR
nr:ribosomal protein S18 [Palmellopsis texensis]